MPNGRSVGLRADLPSDRPGTPICRYTRARGFRRDAEEDAANRAERLVGFRQAAEIFQGANVVENAIQSKDYLGAAKAAAALAGKLSGNGETNGATKLLAAAEDVRTAVSSSKLKDILASLDKLRKTVKEVTHETHKSALPALTAGDDLQAARRRALIA